MEAEPDLMAVLRERLRLRPLDRSDNPNRTHQLKGQLAQKLIGDRKLPQWQHEITAAGRLFYCPDREARVVWVTRVDLRPSRGNRVIASAAQRCSSGRVRSRQEIGPYLWTV